MDFGLGIYNPGGDLIASSVSAGYRYLGQAYIVSNSTKSTATSGGITYGDVTPYVLRIQMVNTNDIPIVGIQLHSGIVHLDQMYHLGGGLWEIQAYSVTYDPPPEYPSVSACNVAGITVHVWAPYTTPTGYGLVVYTASGAVAFNSAQKPLIIRQVVNVGFLGYSYNNNIWSPSSAQNLVNNGQAITSSAATTPVIITNGYGGGNFVQNDTGNDIAFDRWGWSLTGGTLYRRRFCPHRALVPYNSSVDEYNGSLFAANAMIVEGNGL